MEAGGYAVVMGCMVFVTFSIILFGTMGVSSSISWLTPTTFAIAEGVGLCIALVLPTNLEVTVFATGVTSNPRALALGLWMVGLFVYMFSLRIPSSMGGILWAVILVPSFVGVGLAFVDANKQ